MFPVDEFHRLVGLADGDLYRDAVANELVGPEICLVERGPGRIGGSFKLLEGGGNVPIGIAAGLEVFAQNGRFDWAVVLPTTPVAEVSVAEAIRARRIGKQRDDAILRLALGARLLRH